MNNFLKKALLGTVLSMSLGFQDAFCPKLIASFDLEHEIKAMVGFNGFSPSYKILALGRGNDIVIFDPIKQSPVWVLRGHTNPVVSLAITEDLITKDLTKGLKLVSKSVDNTVNINTVNIWSLDTGKLIETIENRTFPGHEATIVDLNFCNRHAFVNGKELQIWDCSDGWTIVDPKFDNEGYIYLIDGIAGKDY